MDPNCPHCKNLAPEYKKAAAALRGEPFTLAKVDATREYGLSRRFEVKGFPTLLWFVKGDYAQQYGGRRSMGGLVEWVHEQVLPPVRRAEDPLPEPLSKPRFAWYAPELTDAYEHFADKHRAKAAFYYVKAASERISMMHVGDSEAVEAPGSFTESFLKQNALPEFVPFTDDVFQLVKAQEDMGIARVFYLTSTKKGDFLQRIDPVIRASKRALGERARKYAWLSVDIDDPKMKLDCHQFPCISVTKDTAVRGGTRYIFGDYPEEVWSVENIVDFFKDVDRGVAEGVEQAHQRMKGPRYTKKKTHTEL